MFRDKDVIMKGPLKTETYLPVYDSDAHIAEPSSVWEEYADPKYLKCEKTKGDKAANQEGFL